MSSNENPSDTTPENPPRDTSKTDPMIMPAVNPTIASVDSDAAAAAATGTTRIKGPRFDELGLYPDVLRALEEMGFQEAMEVQAATLPLARQGRDLMVQSRTGSGKTAAFGIPFVNDIVDPEAKYVQAIVLLPTRELALQVAAELARIAVHRPITVAPIYGGAPMGRQVEMLRAGAQIVCGTPGRILDHLRRGTLTLDRVRCAVLDECDEMLSMGFQEDIEHILEGTPPTRQTLLFSATVPEGIQRLSRRFMKNPEFLKLSADFVGVHEIRHVYYSIPAINREQELLRILNFEEPKTAIIFCNTRDETGRVASFLQKQGFEAEAISSDLAQNDRERVLTRMRAGQIRFLVATDVAARGIDIEALSHVFNYTFPEAPEIYIHRTGRTGRAGKHGTAISLIGPTEVGSFYYLKLLYKIRPEERALPSEAEIRSHREGERVLQLRQALTGEPGTQWRELARRLIGAVDGERLIAALLAQSFAALPGMPLAPVAIPASGSGALPDGTGSRGTAAQSGTGQSGAGQSGAGQSNDRRTESGTREGPMRQDRVDRNERGDRGRDRGRERDRPIRPDRTDRGDRLARGRRPERGPERNRPPERAGEPRPPTGASESGEKEFWEVWSEEKAAAQREAGAVQASPPDISRAAAADSAPVRDLPARSQSIPEGIARLYLNLGRKDGANEPEVRRLLQEHAAIVEVPDIDVMNTHTYLNVANDDADRICLALTGKRIGERDLVCERARPRR
jgi:ATP-dependent RNA helicase DeaD